MRYGSAPVPTQVKIHKPATLLRWLAIDIRFLSAQFHYSVMSIVVTDSLRDSSS